MFKHVGMSMCNSINNLIYIIILSVEFKRVKGCHFMVPDSTTAGTMKYFLPFPLSLPRFESYIKALVPAKC